MNKCNLFHQACKGLFGREISRALMCKPKTALSAGDEPSTGTEPHAAQISASQPVSKACARPQVLGLAGTE